MTAHLALPLVKHSPEFVDCSCVPGHYPGDDALDLFRIGNSSHADFGDQGMANHDVFNLRSVDVEARGFDHPLQTHAEVEGTVGILSPQISGGRRSVLRTLQG